MGSEPKRHHQVPIFYLERFSSNRKLWVRWRDGKQYPANPVNVAVEAGFYDIPDGAGGKSRVVESWFLGKGVEGPAKTAMESLDRCLNPQGLTDAQRKALAIFLALQITRTTAHREETLFQLRVLDWAKGREITRDLVAEYLEHEHLWFKPCDPEIEAAFVYVSEAVKEPSVLTNDWSVRMMIDNAGYMVPVLLDLYWTIEVDPKREYLTSDKPVVLWRKPSPRDNYEGLGVANSQEIRFPLDPGKQLVMSQRKRPTILDVATHRVRRSNRDLADSCHRFILGSPNNRAQITAQHLDARRPVIRFWSGPWLAPGPDGRLQKQEGDIIQMMVPRRAGVGPPSADEYAKTRSLGYIVKEP
jgi:hypothetical protein